MAPKSLDHLPEEILARIASSGPADSVFALTRTCRTLYRTCYDTLFFKSIVESRRSLWECSSMPDVATLSRHIDSQDTLTWACFAVADQRARKPHRLTGLTRGAQAVYDCGFRQGRERWLPHLIVAGYPITQLPCGDHSRFHSGYGAGLVISVKHRFCLAAALLNIPYCDLDQVSFYWTRPAICAMQEKSLSESINTCDPGTVEEDPWTTRLHRHVAKMSEPVFLMSGQWCGYYDCTGKSFFDPPMVAIQFTVSRRLDTESATREVRGKGHDGIARFVLGGHISSDCTLSLRKTYVGSHSWDWTCFMTPFGILGRWGTEEEQGMKRVSLWLWKQEWG